MAANIGCHRRSVRRILRKIGLSKKFGQWIPYKLSEKMRRERVKLAQKNLERIQNEGNFF